jgi:hypothetical protein
VGFVGTGGELIEFRYWNARKKKLFYSDFRFKRDDNAHVGSFKKSQCVEKPPLRPRNDL